MHKRRNHSGKNLRTSDENEHAWVCPNCLTRYKQDNSAETTEPPLCDRCRVPLIQENQNHAEFRCARCKFRILTPEGLWCTRKHKFPRRYDVDRCVAFVARRRRQKGDKNERND